MDEETTTPEPETPPPAADPAPDAPAAAPADAGPKSMLEAINAGIASANGEPPPEPEPEDPDAPEKPKEPAAPAKDATKQPAKDAAKEPGKEPPAKDAKPPAAKDPAAPAKPKPAKEPEPAGPVDPVNDPIPAEVKGRTRERMTQLISTVKEVSTERDQVRGQFNEILGLIEETGASPEQYGQALDYLRAVNSRDPAQIKAAIAVAQRELYALASMIGEPVPGIDMLAQHADLIAEIEDGKISRARAEEIAAARARRASDAQQGQIFQQQQHQQQALAQAKSRLNVVETELRNTDPLYQAKKDMLVPLLQPVLAALPPAKWERAFRDAYARVVVPANGQAAPGAVTTTQNAREPLRVQQPLRAQQHAGTARREASSMLDAINEGIEIGSRRR